MGQGQLSGPLGSKRGQAPPSPSLEDSGSEKLKSQDFLQRKTKGQQLKGKIVSALFSHSLALFVTISHAFSEFSEPFLQDFFLELRGLTTVLGQRDESGKKKQ